MIFSKPISEIIKIRKSCRTYSNVPIEEQKRAAIEKFAAELSTEDFRFVVIDKDGPSSGGEKIGTYGVIKGATAFVTGIMKSDYKTMENFGYAFEKIVLYLTDLGLGTCWLGASFERKKLSSRLHIADSEIVPIVTPAGYPGSGLNIHSTLVKLIARPDKRLPWNRLFYSENLSTPLDSGSADTFTVPLEMVRLGPSAQNLQPWRILRQGNAFHFFLKRNSLYTRMLPYDIQRNDIGIAMCHFELSAEELGLKGSWDLNKSMANLNSNNSEYIISWIYHPIK
jgi:nitroreductase